MNEENLRGYAGNPRMRDLVLSALILSQRKRTGMGMDQWVGALNRVTMK